MRRVVRRVVHADRLADGVVELDGVDPHMGAGADQPLGRQLGAKNAKLPRGRVVLHRRQRTIDQVQHLGRMRQPRAPALDHVPGGPRQPLAPLGILGARIVEDDEIVFRGLDRQCQAGLEQLEQRDHQGLASRAIHAGLDHRAIVAQLVELEDQPFREGRRPADIGPAVGIVADPGRQGEQARAQPPPVGRVKFARHVERHLVDLPHDRPRLRDDHHRLDMLLLQIEPGRRAVHQLLGSREELAQLPLSLDIFLRRRTKRGRGKHGLELHAPPEGRVGGEDKAVVHALEPLGEDGERCRPTVLVARLLEQQLSDRLAVARRVELTQVAARRCGAVGERLPGQPLDQGLNRGLIQCP